MNGIAVDRSRRIVPAFRRRRKNDYDSSSVEFKKTKYPKLKDEFQTPNILNKDPADKRPKNDKSPVSLKQEFDPTDGAAMRAGVQTGDRIIKVNGTLVTHSNHIEVVKLIKSGSYVALTVLGRPPGLQIPLEEEEGEREREEEGAEVGSPSSSSPAALPGPEPSSPWTSGTPPLPDGDENKTTHRQTADNLLKMLTRQRLDLQAKEEECSRSPRAKLLREIEEAKKQLSLLQEQLGRVSQLCFLYADMHKQTSSKESRRFFVEFHSLFMDRTANLKVPVPETIAAELGMKTKKTLICF
ncbi:hypothetical protein F2P81_024918 [Scophthalmus maximus]|uniref:PDZ domain-containing protein n=1 Tax=Scophthalmus maximus TaxID=52904 RepID=A0A6A4RRK9_SCOMX|nr:hypothetical protein F2P81_024918 [Scophthalmus maximus]